MADMNASVLLTLKNRLSGGIKTAGRDINSFARTGQSALGRLNKAISGTAGKLGAIGGGLGLTMAAKGVIDLEKKMVRLGTQAGKSASEMAALKKRIFDVSRNNKIKIDSSQLLGAVDAIIERTGDMDFVEANMESIAASIQASGASGESIGGLFAEFQKMGLGAKEALAAIDTLTIQGKNGAFTLENLAALGPRVINAYTATGRSGTQALTEMGAVLQVIRRGTGSSEQAATSFEALMRSLTDGAKQKKLKAMGISVYDTAGKFRSITEIMQDVVRKSKGDLKSLGAIFDSEAIRAFNAAISEFQRTGATSSLSEFLQMQGKGSTIFADSARNSNTMAANLTNLKTAFADFADDNLAEPLEKVSNVISSLTPEDFDRWMNGAKKIALGFIALKGAGAVVGTLSSVAGLVSGARRMKGGKSLPGGLSGAAGAMPVFVANMPGGGMLGDTGGGAGAAVMLGGAKGRLSAMKDVIRKGGIRGKMVKKLFPAVVKISTAAGKKGLLGGALRFG